LKYDYNNYTFSDKTNEYTTYHILNLRIWVGYAGFTGCSVLITEYTGGVSEKVAVITPIKSRRLDVV